MSVKKLFITGVLTGIGHLLALALLPVLTRHTTDEVIRQIALIDGLLVVYVSILSFGSQILLARDIALSDSWQVELQAGINNRLASAFILMVSVTTFAAFIEHETQLVYFASCVMIPLIALNADFALYARGLPIQAAIVSFVRQSCPLIFFLTSVLLMESMNEAFLYILVLSLFLLLSGKLTSSLLGINYWVKPKFNIQHNIRKVIGVGLSGLSLSYMRSGLILVCTQISSKEDIKYIFGCIKIYLVYIGVRRLLVQVFYANLLNKKVHKVLDLSLLLFSFILVVLVLSYTEFLSKIYFNSDELSAQMALILIVFTIFCSSLFFTSSTRLNLNKQDNIYIINHIVSFFVFAGTTITLILLGNRGVNLIIALIAGELILGILNLRAINNRTCNKV